MLKASFKGMGTDDKQLVYLTALFSDQARSTINQIYEQMGYGNLIDDIRSELKGTYEDVVVAFF